MKQRLVNLPKEHMQREGARTKSKIPGHTHGLRKEEAPPRSESMIWRGRRRIEMCFRKSGEARGPQRRKCSLVYEMLQTGRNYGDCKNAARTSFNNV